MKITGRITQMQSITGTIKVMSDSINGTVGDVVCINGTISRQTKRLSGTVKNPSHVHGIINKPSGQGKNDHVFVIVDLIKFHEQQLIVNSGIGLAFPSTTVSVNSMTANNIAFSSGNITVNKEVLSNATA